MLTVNVGDGIKSHPNSCCIALSCEVFDNIAPTLPSRFVLSTRLVGSPGSNHLLVAFTAKCFVKQGECEREGGGKDGNIDFASHFRISHVSYYLIFRFGKSNDCTIASF